MSIERPALYVVATPIGNLDDLSPRAAALLGAVDLVLCEDTRRTRPLLEHLGLGTPLKALHEHNEKREAAAIIEQLVAARAAYALVSDAGTPLVSDPGYALVNAAAARGLPVVAVPGPSALTAALSVAGLPTDRFVFEGFLPASAAARARRLEALAREPRTLVFYEAPHRLAAALQAMRAAFGDGRPAAVARELSKRFEQVYRGSLGELAAAAVEDGNMRRGELVVLVGGAPSRPGLDELDRVLDAVLPLTDRRTAQRIAAALTGLGRNAVYRRILERAPGNVEKPD
ncbi:MAG: 16S rRNA (cytidine(1402)-2'-O)-methyltransferase [Gammaproteobacteria bacterium]